ncbi:MAG: sugar ABC transporter ATP-binding protein [Blautia sp.]|nr:sugar ABC transporter ATP-binding protein [Blautia sp.]MDY5031625.1 sugar ABC transporter ATP-binding protein [Blautia sp.]
MSEHVLLQMKNIHKSFPGVKALQAVDFELRAGEVHALLGENGAGKSTLIKVLGGIYIAEEGEIFINGRKVNIDSVNASHENGIAIIHQELVLVPYMTVAENIFLGREAGGKLVKHEKMERDAQELLDAYGLNFKADTLVKNLTIAQQQMVEIIKAISYDSKILVMDEPTSSISDKEVSFLFETMRALTAKGVGIIYISHKMSELEQICDRVTVMRDGMYVGTEVVKETNKDKLIAMMVGRELTNYYTRDFLPQNKEIVLKCDNIADGKMAKGASFEVHKGEIVGFAGLVGAGRSETMKAVFGLTPGSTGDVYVDGKKVSIKSPVDAIKYGIALVPEDRKLEGLYKVQSVRFNSTIEVLGEFIRRLRVNAEKEEEITQKYIDMMATKTPSQEQTIGNLSGGNQQKVMIGRWLATSPKLLILDEPTRGVDVGAKAEIYGIMNELAKQGMSIIMISSELPEILNMSDRIYVMCDGKVTGCFAHDEGVTQETIMKLAAK